MTVAVASGPIQHKRRRESTVIVTLRCACGYLERWPVPPTAAIGRCTCPRCGEQLHEDDSAPAINNGRLR